MKCMCSKLGKNLLHRVIHMNMGEGYFVGIISMFEKFFRLSRKNGQSKKN